MSDRSRNPIEPAEPESGTAPRLVDQGGRALGPRALSTRQRILDSTARLLNSTRLRDLRVIEIARDVGTSPATFYQYFKDVEDVVLYLAEEASEQMPAMTELIAGSWSGEAGIARARKLVDSFIRHWDQHSAILRVRNMASDEGDPRFQAVRSRTMLPVIQALATKIAELQGEAGANSLNHPHAAAAAMAAILERLAAYHRELEIFGVTREHLVETSANIILQTVAGGRAS